MKRWTIGSIAFLATLAVGFLIADFVSVDFHPDQAPVGQTLFPETEDLPLQTRPSDLETVSSASSWLKAAPFKLLKVGKKYQIDDIDAKNGETWLGLFEENDKYVLRDARLKIKNVRIDMKDEYDGGTGLRRNVGVEGTGKPVFLVEKAAKPREGGVQTVFRGPDYLEALSVSPDKYIDKISLFSDGFVRDFQIATKSYSLKVTRMLDTDGRNMLVLTLETDGVRQILHASPAEGLGEDGKWLGQIGQLYWVGDIDRDGKLDLYLSFFTTDIMYDAFLFTTTKAKNGEIVGKAASFHLTPGC